MTQQTAENLRQYTDGQWTLGGAAKLVSTSAIDCEVLVATGPRRYHPGEV